MTIEIIKKIKKAHLLGCGGGNFPVADKWEMVKKAKGKRKFVVCNGSEGEPDVKKDLHILENFPGAVFNGMKIAMDFLQAEEGFLYLNPDYFDKFGRKLDKFAHQMKIEVVRKPHSAGYIGGEETAALNTIENKRTEPRQRPPYPPQAGLWGFPTLVNNVETFYNVSLLALDKYQGKRFITIAGDCLWPGVFEFPRDASLEEILRQTENYPEFEFFLQVGGGISGQVINSSQIGQMACGSGSITIYSKNKTKPIDLFRKWVGFFCEESCGQCTPCREGTYRLNEILKQKSPDWPEFSRILNCLAESSFCALGCSVPVPIRSYFENVLRFDQNNKIELDPSTLDLSCECLK